MNKVFEKEEREEDWRFYMTKESVWSVLFVELLIARIERDREYREQRLREGEREKVKAKVKGSEVFYWNY